MTDILAEHANDRRGLSTACLLSRCQKIKIAELCRFCGSTGLKGSSLSDTVHQSSVHVDAMPLHKATAIGSQVECLNNTFLIVRRSCSTYPSKRLCQR